MEVASSEGCRLIRLTLGRASSGDLAVDSFLQRELQNMATPGSGLIHRAECLYQSPPVLKDSGDTRNGVKGSQRKLPFEENLSWFSDRDTGHVETPREKGFISQ